MHSPQSMHLSESITAQPLRTRIASVGQCFMQVVQPVHFDESRDTEWMYVFIRKPTSESVIDLHRDDRSSAYNRVNVHIVGVALHIRQTHTCAEAQ